MTKAERRDEGKTADPPPWHARTADRALSDLDSSPSGLSEDEAGRRLAALGPNRLPAAARRSTLLRFLLQFHNLLIYVLIAAAGITVFLDHMVDAAVILAVVIANAVIGFLQEGKAERAMDAIRHMLALHAAAVRGGERTSIDGEALVPGDIVLLEAGDKVPADLRLLQAHGLFVQESALTGESVPVEKRTEPVAAAAALGDRACMAFSGTLVTSGQGVGVVVETGAATEIGRIGGLLSDVETLTTPLVLQMGVFARWLTVLILLVAGLLLVYGHFVAHRDFTEMFMVVIGISVAAIPEGLPAVLTITLAIGVQSMARRNAIVRRLPAIETLGSVSVICTDKTGTLTRNEMMVASIATGAGRFTVGGNGYEPAGEIVPDGTAGEPGETGGRGVLAEFARAAALCNDAALQQHEGVWTVEGDPMEGALLAFAAKAGLNVRAERAAWPRTATLPFDARHRFMATVHREGEGEGENGREGTVVFVKGAPEQILGKCRDQRTADGGREPVDDARWHAAADEIAALGQRVLALAAMPAGPARDRLAPADIEGRLTLLGLVGLIDPPRPEAIAAVADCHKAGIRVKMITGDHAGTAVAIARQIGIAHPDRALLGADIDGMDDAILKDYVLDTDVFARTSPEHKLRLVMALQSHGLTVAMTGDGVNDAPALKRADAGIAMGRKGSEAAKEAAELVLTDDNFASIAAAVREGRTVYDNIKKVISWTLPTNAGEALTIIVALLAGMTLPITPIQILWVNLITAMTLGMALAFEPSEDNTMRRPPRPRNEPLLGGELIWYILLVSVLFLCAVFGIYAYAVDRGYSLELARTLSLNTLVVMEIFQLFFIRNIYGTSLTWKAVRGTRVVWLTVAIVVVAQFAITYLPPLQRVFATEAVPLADGLLIVGIGVMLFAVLETEKQIRLAIRRRAAPAP